MARVIELTVLAALGFLAAAVHGPGPRGRQAAFVPVSMAVTERSAGTPPLTPRQRQS
jgi:hypothetical protein